MKHEKRQKTLIFCFFLVICPAVWHLKIGDLGVSPGGCSCVCQAGGVSLAGLVVHSGFAGRGLCHLVGIHVLIISGKALAWEARFQGIRSGLPRYVQSAPKVQAIGSTYIGGKMSGGWSRCKGCVLLPTLLILSFTAWCKGRFCHGFILWRNFLVWLRQKNIENICRFQKTPYLCNRKIKAI